MLRVLLSLLSNRQTVFLIHHSGIFSPQSSKGTHRKCRINSSVAGENDKKDYVDSNLIACATDAKPQMTLTPCSHRHDDAGWLAQT